MAKAAVVFWSATGNTEAMAAAVADGAKVDLLQTAAFSASDLAKYDAVAFGCPAMGAEELEEDEVEPLFAAMEGDLGGKKIALFGSYGWGDGEWMRTWEERVKNAGAVLTHDSVICCEAPDEDAVEACKALGASLNQ
ncbi:MAG: flavodoxin [Lachnospiraceae bacterium]|nr:flavodoxin [Lachnospiraceae bacterium]